MPEVSTSAPEIESLRRAADDPSLGSLLGRALLLANDATLASRAATRAAGDLAARNGARVEVLTVHDTIVGAARPAVVQAVQIADAILGDDVHDAQVRAVRGRLEDTLGFVPDWPVRVEVGTPAACILKAAARAECALVVMGLRHHATAARPFRDETTLHVMRRAGQPVLAVVEGATDAPRHFVVGLGFGPASIAAARSALTLLGASGTVTLAYVGHELDFMGEDDSGHRLIQLLGIARAFEQTIALLAPPDGVRIETVTLRGNPGTELADLADRVGADAIAVGSQRHNRVDRWILGSVTADLARGGRHSLLVVPPRQWAPR